MKSYLRTFYRSERGVLSIEFTLTFFIVFLPVFLLMIEVARLSYVAAVLNFTVSEAGKIAKNTPGNPDYKELFRDQLQKHGRLWNLLTHPGALQVKVCFSSIESLAEDIEGDRGKFNDLPQYCKSNNTADRPLARYRLDYTYQTLFFPLPAEPIQKLLRNEVIFVQEY